MKFYLIALVFTSHVLAAAEAPLPAFAGKIGEIPALSLSELLKTGPLLLWNEKTTVTAARPRPVSQSEKKFGSRMPVIPPPTGVDHKMLVAAPDSSTDFKLIVKEPGVESVK
jgi:hypothetical protein